MTQILKKTPEKTIIYQGENGEIILKGDYNNDTIWANQSHIADIFGIDQSVVSRHIKNIFKDGEIEENSNMQKMHIANSDKPVTFYSLDIILSVGYRTNGTKAITFRKWSNSILKQYITEGIAVNNSILQENTQKFEQALEYLNKLSPNTISKLEAAEIISLIQNYSQTWLNLDNFDKQNFPTDGTSSRKIQLSGEDLATDIAQLKTELIKKGEATELFAQEKQAGNLQGIFGNVFQSFGGEDLYSSLEEKAAHLLYFIIKNHPFTDGNKRSGAFSFIWFLQKSEYNKLSRITPETLTSLTLLIAQSTPKEKEKMIGLVLLLLQ